MHVEYTDQLSVWVNHESYLGGENVRVLVWLLNKLWLHFSMKFRW